MSENDRIILDQILDQQRQAMAPTLAAVEYFEIFAAEQALKEYDLSYDELQAGLTGGGADGGFDAVYVFANGEPVQEDTDLTALKRGVQLDLVVVQATTSQGFSESRVEKLAATTRDVFDLSRKLGDLTTVYNAGVLGGAATFRRAYEALAARFPRVVVRYVIAAKADSVHPNVQRKAEELRKLVLQLFSSSECEVAFLTTAALLELARRVPRESFSLQLAETPISSAGQMAFIALVRLRDFYDFITENGVLQRQLFEANVRDYQGATEVNEEIRATLDASPIEDFWWLNNGVTVVATKAVQSGKTLMIEDPQIVNGLQTSTQVFNHFANSGDAKTDDRNILVRVIVPKDPASRDRIIKATNSQTYIPPASLRATDKIHRDIEDFLKPRGLYYDRRKNFYKNQGIAVDRIVGIPYMAQAVMSIALRRPDDARSRPSSLIKKDEDYRRIFSPTRPIATYYACAVLLKRTETFLKTAATISVQYKGNIRFHVAMAVATLVVARLAPTDQEIAGLDVQAISDATLQQATELVVKEFEALGGTDSVAKAAELVTRVREALDAALNSGTSS